MPTYGYECIQCRHQFEIVQSIKDNPLTICDQCGGSLRKRVFPVGIAFKGSGFYVNDYASSSSSVGSTTPKTEPAASTNTAKESTSETKTEATASV